MNKSNSNREKIKIINHKKSKKIAMLTIAPITMLTITSVATPNVSFAEEINQKYVVDKIKDEENNMKSVNHLKPNLDYIAPGAKKVTGKAEVGSKISIRVFDPSNPDKIMANYISEKIVLSDGLFSVDIASPSKGALVFVYAEKNGVKSANQASVGEGDGEISIPTVNEVKDIDTKITGNAKPGVKVVAKVDDHEIGNSYVDENGEFNIDIPKQMSGTKIVISVTDNQGMSKISEVTVTETIPSVPIINKTLKDTDTKIIGVTKPGAKVIAKVGNQELGNSQANEKGMFNIDIPKQISGTKITVVASNSIGVSEGAITQVQLTSPANPLVNDLTDIDKKITGEAKPYSIVTVNLGGHIRQGQADKDGKFSISIPIQKKGNIISVLAWNSAGRSAESNVTVKTAKPNVPILDYIAPGAKKVTGKAEVGSKVSIRVFDPFNSKQIIANYKSEKIVSSDGVFSVDIASPSRGAVVFVYAEKNGLQSTNQANVGS